MTIKWLVFPKLSDSMILYYDLTSWFAAGIHHVLVFDLLNLFWVGWMGAFLFAFFSLRIGDTDTNFSFSLFPFLNRTLEDQL